MTPLLGVLLAAVAWLWVRTLRVTIESRARLDGGSRRRVLAFLHGQQMALLTVPRTRPAAVLVSRSRDGELQARVMRAFRFRVVRGSSSRGGAGGLAGVVALLQNGFDAAFAVDGPRGPSGVPKGGAAFAARAASADLLPAATAMRRGWVLRRAWDAFEIPLPFSRVAVAIGDPVDVAAAEGDPSVLARAIALARARATELVAAPRAGRASPLPGAPCKAASR